ncbi:MAG: hypothetical protein WCF57_10650 [Pyrinomonadaceae bacterium]
MSAPKIILFSTAFLLLALFAVWYVKQERYVYFWDYAGYHILYRELGAKLAQSPSEALGSVVTSVRNNEYNTLPSLLQMPFYLAFGPRRLPYILSVTILYAFPAIFLFTLLLRRLDARDAGEKKWDDLALTFISLVVIALAPPLWLPLLLGYVDVIGLNVIFIILMLYFRKDLAAQTTRSLIAMGLLLSLLILLRRWYAYWVVGFFCATSIDALLSYLPDRTQLKKVGLGFRNILIMGLVAVVSFFIVATPIALRMLTTDYRDVFSAYRSSDSTFQHFVRLYHYFGLLLVAASVVGLLAMAAKEGKRRVAIFMAIQFITAFLLFNRTQDLNGHHYYWVAVTIFMMAAYFLRAAYSRLKTWPLKAVFIIVLCVVALSNLLVVFHPGVSRFLSPVETVYSQNRLPPLRRNDLNQVYGLLTTLRDLTRGSDSRIYILASSVKLNAGIAQNALYDFEPPMVELERNLYSTADVDKRDGFPFHLYNALYVVVTNPVAYHLASTDQRVVGVVAEELIKGEGLARSYERLPYEFPLEDGSKAYIYKKVRPFDAGDLKRISDTFVRFYPAYKERFEIKPDMLRALSGP